jgi:hypothetical protein
MISLLIHFWGLIAYELIILVIFQGFINIIVLLLFIFLDKENIPIIDRFTLRTELKFLFILYNFRIFISSTNFFNFLFHFSKVWDIEYHEWNRIDFFDIIAIICDTC